MRISKKVITLLLAAAMLSAAPASAFAADEVQNNSVYSNSVSSDENIQQPTQGNTEAFTEAAASLQGVDESRENDNSDEVGVGVYKSIVGTVKSSADTTQMVGGSKVIVGDVNLDGAIDGRDILTIQKYMACLIGLSDDAMLAAKTTNSDDISVYDILNIQKYMVSGENKYEKADPDFNSNRVCVTNYFVSNINLNTYSLNLKPGGSASLKASVTPSSATNKKLTWTSSNTSVATVDSNGNIKGVKCGSCYITCASADGSGAKKYCIVNVCVPVTQVKLNSNYLKWPVGRSAYYYPVVTPDNATNKRLIWTTSDSKVAVVSSDGKLTSTGPGRCTITCRAADGSGACDTCVVDVSVPVTQVKLNSNYLKWPVGKTAYYYPVVTPDNATNKKLIWTTSDPKVAVVSEDGKLTSISKGTCTITCKAADGSGAYDTCLVEVRQQVTGISLNKSAATVKEGKTVQLSAIIKPDNANNKNVTWSSSNERIITVNSNGTVRGVSAGTATITCRSNDNRNFSATCKITVEPSKSKGQQIADYAAQWVGVTPYVWGGTSLTYGADCSGFVCSIYDHFGYNLWGNRTTLSNEGYSVSLANAQPGDIVVFYGHVAIYAGDGMVTHALNENLGTLTTPVSWGGTVKCVRRIV